MKKPASFFKSQNKQWKIKPLKRLGQNFLVDKKVLRKIIEAASLSKNDVVLEVGAGIGNLTKELAKRAKKVIAIEKDSRMIEILKEALKNFENVEIVQADILKLDSKFQIPKDYKIVANLPYYLTSAFLRKFLETKKPPKEMVLMVQKEVAERIVVKPPKMNLLALSVQFYAKAKIISFVSKNSFWPKPKVDSAIIKISNIKTKFSKSDRESFFKIVKIGFSHPRKQLINNLSQGLKVKKEKVKDWLLKNGIGPKQRAETLKIEDWLNLAKSYKMVKDGKNLKSD